MQYNREWGTICADLDSNSATVICRQLGYTYGVYNGIGQYPLAPIPIVYDYVRCRGDEARLDECILRHAKGTAHCPTDGARVLCKFILLLKYCSTIVHFKRLGSRGFHDLFNYYLCFFSKHNEYCKTEAYFLNVVDQYSVLLDKSCFLV